MVLRQWTIPMQKNEFGPLPNTIHKDYPKWIIDLNVRAKTTKVKQNQIFVALGQTAVFLSQYKILKLQNKKDNINFIKIIKFCASNDTIKKLKRQQNRIKYPQIMYLTRDFIQYTYTPIIQLNNQSNVGKVSEQTFLQRDANAK